MMRRNSAPMRLFESLAGAEPDAFSRELGMALEDLRRTAINACDHARAETAQPRAVDVYRVLTGKYPDAFGEYLRARAHAAGPALRANRTTRYGSDDE